MGNKFTYGLDLSMSNTGVVVFKGDIPIYVGSIPTSSKDTHGVRLKVIYDFLSELKDKYPPNLIVIERGFSKFNTSTAVLYRVHGCVNMLFSDVKQIYYPPKTVKEAVCGSGKATKANISDKVKELFPHIMWKNDDETDACAVALTHFQKRKEDEKNINNSKKK